jgi:hypothetical protein
MQSCPYSRPSLSARIPQFPQHAARPAQFRSAVATARRQANVGHRGRTSPQLLAGSLGSGCAARVMTAQRAQTVSASRIRLPSRSRSRAASSTQCVAGAGISSNRASIALPESVRCRSSAHATRSARPGTRGRRKRCPSGPKVKSISLLRAQGPEPPTTLAPVAGFSFGRIASNSDTLCPNLIVGPPDRV